MEENSNTWDQEPINYSPQTTQVEESSMSKASFIVGIIAVIASVILFWTVYVPIILGGFAIIFAILSRNKEGKLPKKAKIGLSTAIIGCCINIGVIIALISFAFNTLRNNPEFWESFTEGFNEAYEDIYGDYSNDELENYYQDYYENIFEQIYGDEYDIDSFTDTY